MFIESEVADELALPKHGLLQVSGVAGQSPSSYRLADSIQVAHRFLLDQSLILHPSVLRQRGAPPTVRPIPTMHCIRGEVFLTNKGMHHFGYSVQCIVFPAQARTKHVLSDMSCGGEHRWVRCTWSVRGSL